MKKSLIFIFSLLLCVTNVGYIHAEDELPSEVPESSEVEHDEESLNNEYDDVLDEASIESDEEQVLEETTETLDTDNWDVDNVVQDEQDSLDSLNDEESIINVETNVENLEIDSLVEEDALDTAPGA